MTTVIETTGIWPFSLGTLYQTICRSLIAVSVLRPLSFEVGLWFHLQEMGKRLPEECWWYVHFVRSWCHECLMLGMREIVFNGSQDYSQLCWTSLVTVIRRDAIFSVQYQGSATWYGLWHTSFRCYLFVVFRIVSINLKQAMLTY